MIKHPQIYKRDSKGKTRVWSQEQNGSSYRTVAGILDGNLVTSAWTVCVGKQGRTDEEQASFEVAAAYKNKLTGEYHESLDTISDGAHFFKPMLAEVYTGFSGPVYAQPKLDGARCIVTKDGVFSRKGKPLPGAKHILEALQPLFAEYPEVILDGELYNHTLKDDFNELMSMVKKGNPTPERDAQIRANVQYHVYDMPSYPGNFGTRTDAVQEVLKNLNHRALVTVPTFFVTNIEILNGLYASWIEQGYEGQMVRLDAPYENKRTFSLLKRKEFQDEEFEVISIEEGIGNWAGVAKSVRCRLPDGREFGAGIKGSKQRAKELLTETHKVVTVKFFELTPAGVPRFPIAVKFHGAERTL